MEQYEVIVGALLPLVVSVVVAAQWRLWLKVSIAVGTSVVAGTVAVFVAGQATAGSWLATVAAIFTASQASYHLFWKPTGIGVRLEQWSWLSDRLAQLFHRDEQEQ